MKKILSFILVLFISLSITGCTEVTEPSKTENKTEYKINETANVDNVNVKINSVKKIYSECSWEYDGECYSLTEPEKDYFLLIDLTLENNRDEEVSISSILQFELKMPDGEKAENEYMLNAVTSSLDGNIMANDLLKGQIAFDVSDEEYYYFYYQDGLLGDSIKFVINNSDIIE